MLGLPSIHLTILTHPALPSPLATLLPFSLSFYSYISTIHSSIITIAPNFSAPKLGDSYPFVSAAFTQTMLQSMSCGNAGAFDIRKKRMLYMRWHRARPLKLLLLMIPLFSKNFLNETRYFRYIK